MVNLPRFTRESYLRDYINDPSPKGFKARLAKHKKKYPKSYYCYICDCRRMLDWHHIRYDTLGHEDFFRDGWHLCDPLCPCGCGCHFASHRRADGQRIMLVRRLLEARRKELRQGYVRSHLKPTTVLPFLATWLYRLFW